MVYADVETLDSNIWYDRTKNIIYKDSEGFKSIVKRTESILNDIKNKYNLHLTKNDKLFVVEDSNTGCIAAISFKNQVKDIDVKVIRFTSNHLVNTTDFEKTDFIAKNSN